MGKVERDENDNQVWETAWNFVVSRITDGVDLNMKDFDLAVGYDVRSGASQKTCPFNG